MTLKPTSIRLPHYVRVRAEEYVLHHPRMRFRHLVIAGFKKLGIKVNKDDRVAKLRTCTLQRRCNGAAFDRIP